MQRAALVLAAAAAAVLVHVAALPARAEPAPAEIARRALQRECDDGNQAACANLSVFKNRPPMIETEDAPAPLVNRPLPALSREPAVTKEQKASSWTYRKSILKIDIPVGLLAVISGLTWQDGMAMGVVLISATTVPGLHLFNHRPGRAAASLVMRVALPFTLAHYLKRCEEHPGFDPLSEDSSCGYTERAGTAIGLAGGTLAAMLIEQILLVPSAEDMPSTPSVSPTVMAHPSGASIGLVGTF